MTASLNDDFRGESLHPYTDRYLQGTQFLLIRNSLMPSRPYPPDFRSIAYDVDITSLLPASLLHWLSNTTYVSEDNIHWLHLTQMLKNAETRRSIIVFLRQNRGFSARASWGKLLKISVDMRHKDAFRGLLGAGIENEWLYLDEMDSCYLQYSCQVGCLHAVKRILSALVPTRPIQGCRLVAALTQAIKNDNLECFECLVKNHDVSRRFNQRSLRRSFADPKRTWTTTFLEFMEILHQNDNGWPLWVEWESLNVSQKFLRGLQMFLENGAHVTVPFIGPWNSKLRNLYEHPSIPNSLRPSIMDHLFYRYRKAFDIAAVYSKPGSPRAIIRTGLLIALEKGIDHGLAYLRTRANHSRRDLQRLLQLLVAEQFLCTGKYSKWWILPAEDTNNLVPGLVSLGADLQLPLLPGLTATDLLQAVVADNRSKETRIWVVRSLIDNGAVPNAQVLANVACFWDAEAPDALAVFELLVEHVADADIDGKLALAEAAAHNKFDFVLYLLDMGTAVNSTVENKYLGSEVTILASTFAHGCRNDDDPRIFYPSCEMIQLLIENGADFKLTTNDADSVDFLEYVLVNASARPLQLYEQTVYIISCMESIISKAPPATGYFLDAILTFTTDWNRSSEEVEHTLKIFEALLQCGADIKTGCPLAGLARIGARRGLIDELNHKRTAIDISVSNKEKVESFRRYLGEKRWYFEAPDSPLCCAASRGDEDLVTLLLDCQADVDGMQFIADHDTALQGACKWQPMSSEEGVIKVNIVNRLLDHGADVNRAPPHAGFTALQAAAFRGDLEVAMLLLQQGADIQAPRDSGLLSEMYGLRNEYREQTALDIAAEHGQVDMVKLLLNANGLSASRGNNGYKGAINLARESCHFAVADLI